MAWYAYRAAIIQDFNNKLVMFGVSKEEDWEARFAWVSRQPLTSQMLSKPWRSPMSWLEGEYLNDFKAYLKG